MSYGIKFVLDFLERKLGKRVAKGCDHKNGVDERVYNTDPI
jgi:hypothetical protein